MSTSSTTTTTASSFICTVCSKSFVSKQTLQRHQAAVHGRTLATTSTTTCTYCESTFRDAYSLKRHISSKHKSSACCECEETFVSKALLRDHIEREHKQCKQCGRRFKSLLAAKNHQNLHSTSKYVCKECGRKFLYQRQFSQHVKMHKNRVAAAAAAVTVSQQQISRENSNRLTQKIKTKDDKQQHVCFCCGKKFPFRVLLNQHLKNECIHLPIEDMHHIMDEASIKFDIEFKRALKGCLSEYKFIPNEPIVNEKLCLDYLQSDIIALLKWYAGGNIFLKWSYKLDATFSRQNADGEIELKKAAFSSLEHAFSNVETDRLTELYDNMRQDIISRIDKYSKEGSGWTLANINFFSLHLYRFLLTFGGAAGDEKKVSLPSALAVKHCVINIDSDNYCFKWAVLCALHFNEVSRTNRISCYKKWEKDFEFPITPIVSAKDVCDFVKNSKLAVYTHYLSTNKRGDIFVECTFRPPKNIVINSAQRIHLLLYKNHWMTITSLSRLYKTNAYTSFQMCDCCLATFHSKVRYAQHLPCTPSDCIQREIMPSKEKAFLEFKEFNKAVDVIDIVYADLEAILERLENKNDDDDTVIAERGLTMLQKHVPCCVGAYWVSKAAPLEEQPGIYTKFKGVTCVQQFVNYIDKLAKHIYVRNKTATRIKAQKTSEDLAKHELAKSCVWCKCEFSTGIKQKVFEHDHLTGKYRGASCQGCNNKLRQDRNSLVVAFHNFRGYDSHALCLQGFSTKPNWVLRPIAQTTEKYLSVSAWLNMRNDDVSGEVCDTETKGRRRRSQHPNWFKVKFIDTCQLMPCSLAELTRNLAKSGECSSLLKNALAMQKLYPTLKEEDLTSKGIFPYSYVDSWEKLEETSLPSIDAFYDELEEKVNITQTDYLRAQNMWTAFNCHTLFDYQLHYLELDCRLLADVFEEFRRLTKKEDALDAAHFITVSQLSYTSALKRCNYKIGLITEPEIHRDIERCKRGGYAFVNKHYCKANNPYVSSIQKLHTKEDIYLADIDANNLYGNALRYPLPVGEFQYLANEEIAKIDWLNIDLTGTCGYFIVCDLEYSQSIHEKTKNLPLAPEVCEITEDMLPTYFKQLNSRKNLSRQPESTNPDTYKPVRKLITSCHDKKEYVVHFVALQTYLKHGLIIKKIHRVIKFKQAALFRDYIDYNTERRQQAKNDFEKDYYKAKNCCLFGKSLENKRNRCDILLCTSPHQLIKAASQHRFKSATIFNDNLAAAELTKINIELDAPLAIGAAVLDISKTIMYKLAYEDFPRYQLLFDCKINIVAGDTDSFFLEVIGVDLIGQLYPQMFKDGLLDTSNYAKDHPLYSEKYKAQLGCIKDEFKGKLIDEFILLRPKSYSMKVYEDDDQAAEANKKRSKGVPKRKIKLLTHDDYRKVFFKQCEISVNCRRMQSHKHTVYNIEQQKIALSYADDKRAWHSNNFSLPFGHYLNTFYEQHPPEDEQINDDDNDERTAECLYEEMFPTAMFPKRLKL